MKRSLWVRAWVPCIIFLFGVSAGLLAVLALWKPSALPTASSLSPIRIWDSGYTFVKPLVSYEIARAAQPLQLERRLNEIIEAEGFVHRGTDVGVYVEDLTDGSVATYHADIPFTPASLLKVPLAMAVLHVAASDPNVASAAYVIGSIDENEAQQFRGRTVLERNRLYSVYDVVTALIVASDNNARSVLVNAFGDAVVPDLFAALQIPYPEYDHAGLSFMTPRQYGAVLRALVNGAYLGPETSDWLLTRMAQIEFDGAIRSAIPLSVPVARKFGERTIVGEGDVIHKNELHECGIVYAPARPFIMCIMTRGADMRVQERVIHDTARWVYTQMVAS